MIPAVLALFGALWLVGNSEVRRFENLAARDIRSKLSGAEAKVSVRAELNGLSGPFGDLRRVTIRASDFSTDGLPLFTEPHLSKKGRVRELVIHLSEFTIAGLRIASLSSSIPDCRFDYAQALAKRRIRLSHSGVGRGSVEIRERDLEAFILHKFREIKRVTVSVANGRVYVQGYGEFLILKTNFTVEARLEPVEGSKLVLTEPTILFDGRRADEASRKVLLDTLNPVVDLERDLKLHGAIRLDTVSLENGVLKAGGATTIPTHPDALRAARVCVAVGPWLALAK